MYVVSPYFVPTRTGAKLFTELAESGVEIIVLTNSLEATDVAAVHSGYSRYRKRLLKAGVQLYEMQRLSGQERMHGTGPLGSAGSSLHAKTFAVDGERVFVGSFNFDPRSAQLNTEMGLVIDSREAGGRPGTDVRRGCSRTRLRRAPRRPRPAVLDRTHRRRRSPPCARTAHQRVETPRRGDPGPAADRVAPLVKIRAQRVSYWASLCLDGPNFMSRCSHLMAGG